MIQKAIAMIMLWQCYLIRDKVFFIVVAISALLVIYKEYNECKKLKSTVLCCMILLSLLMGGIAGIEIVHYQAYSSNAWKEYDEFNKARSLLYDFYKLPDYEENKRFYEQENISINTYNNLRNYSLVYDPEIDMELISKIVNYRKMQTIDDGNNLRKQVNLFRSPVNLFRKRIEEIFTDY